MLASETVVPTHGRPRNHFASGSMELSIEPAEARAAARISARQLAYQTAVREYQQQCDTEAEQERAAALWRRNKERVLAEGTSFEPGSMALKEGVCFCEYEPCRCKEPAERVFSGPRALHFAQQAAPVLAPGPGVNDAFGSLAQRRHYPPVTSADPTLDEHGHLRGMRNCQWAQREADVPGRHKYTAEPFAQPPETAAAPGAPSLPHKTVWTKEEATTREEAEDLGGQGRGTRS